MYSTHKMSVMRKAFLYHDVIVILSRERKIEVHNYRCPGSLTERDIYYEKFILESMSVDMD